MMVADIENRVSDQKCSGAKQSTSLMMAAYVGGLRRTFIEGNITRILYFDKIQEHLNTMCLSDFFFWKLVKCGRNIH